MRVSEILTFDQYGRDARFREKRPTFSGSIKQALGDNIYRRNSNTGKWIQINSHHSNANGTPNVGNIRHDTQAPRVLIATEFVYFGGRGPTIPTRFRKPGEDICAHRGHRSNFSSNFLSAFTSWLQGIGMSGFEGPPAEFIQRGWV